jgi:hypothetical protein
VDDTRLTTLPAYPEDRDAKPSCRPVPFRAL